TNPNTTVIAIATTISIAVCAPSAAMSPSPTRSPSKATAQRNRVLTQNCIPGCTAGRAASGLSAIPTTSAITMLGIGPKRGKEGAVREGRAGAMGERGIAGARAAADTDGRKACIFSALTVDSLLARDKVVVGAAGLVARRNRARDFRRRIHEGDTGRFERL